MSSLPWYWHRLRAMDAAEMRGRLRRKIFAFFDDHRQRDWAAVAIERGAAFPKLPDKASAPSELRASLAEDARMILKGHWLAFGHLPLAVDDPPKWDKDYLAGVELASSERASKLDHRRLPNGADIKLIWELSRWHALVRLAQAAWLLEDQAAGRKLLLWLDDWRRHNLPFRGWNWTSALESGMRLIQFAWIDALLHESAATGAYHSELERLSSEVLPPHVWFTWRNRSFGSSANNHLLGELAGLIVATARWPALQKWGAPLPELARLWEREVLAQFAPDGGNREQALNYHLFSFEFCWQARRALEAAGVPVNAAIEERLGRAAEFFLDVQVPSEPWDFGDSDNGFVTPLFLRPASVVKEWCDWLEGDERAGITFWQGKAPNRSSSTNPCRKEVAEWRMYPESGMVIQRAAKWTLRWDLSPLGYLSTAAHGHLDALHLSIWFDGVAMVVDPGTGAYYAEEKIRSYLASWEAHNGPRILGQDWPRRLGPFLWSEHHPVPSGEMAGPNKVVGRLRLLSQTVSRSMMPANTGNGWLIEDVKESGTGRIAVRWQFAPGAVLKKQGESLFQIEKSRQSIWLQIENASKVSVNVGESANDSLAGLCSPSFRQLARGPYLDLICSHSPCVLRSAFLASPP